ncbi:MAG: hypothetical protein ACTHXA_02705 [Gulosibacter sp.]|uniref:hypothetical protein n=1 Tax=Gulosibacter sp. TaxID=2817531 RepID=UPI003F8EBC67
MTMRLFSLGRRRRGSAGVAATAALAFALTGCGQSFDEDAPEVTTAIDFARHLCAGDYLAADAMVANFDQYSNPNFSSNFAEELQEVESIAAERRGEAEPEFEVEVLATRGLESDSPRSEIDLSGTCEDMPFTTTLTVYEHNTVLTVDGSIPMWETEEFIAFEGRAVPLAPVTISSGVQLGSMNSPVVDEWLLPVGTHTATLAPHFMVQEPAELTITSSVFAVSSSPTELAPDTTASAASVEAFIEECGDMCALTTEDIGFNWTQTGGDAVTPRPLADVIAPDGTFTGTHIILQTSPEPLPELKLELNAWSAGGPNSGLAFPARGYGTMLEIICPEGETCSFDESSLEHSSMRVGKFFLAEIDGVVEVVLVDPIGSVQWVGP